MDFRNQVCFAFWLSSLTGNDRIFKAVEKAVKGDIPRMITRNQIAEYTQAVESSNIKPLLEQLSQKDAHKSVIFADRLEITTEVTEYDDGRVWLVSIYFLNVDKLGGVPEYATEAEMAEWCKQATDLANTYCGKLTMSYDVTLGGLEAAAFFPERFQVWRLQLSNPAFLSNRSILPPFSAISVEPRVPSNIEFD